MKLNFILNLRMNFTLKDQCMKIHKMCCWFQFFRNYKLPKIKWFWFCAKHTHNEGAVSEKWIDLATHMEWCGVGGGDSLGRWERWWCWEWGGWLPTCMRSSSALSSAVTVPPSPWHFAGKLSQKGHNSGGPGCSTALQQGGKVKVYTRNFGNLCSLLALGSVDAALMCPSTLPHTRQLQAGNWSQEELDRSFWLGVPSKLVDSSTGHCIIKPQVERSTHRHRASGSFGDLLFNVNRQPRMASLLRKSEKRERIY